MILDATEESAETTCIAECALLDLVEDSRKIRVQLVGAVGVSMAEILDILCEVTEEEDVVLPNLAGDFNLIC